MSGKKKSSLLRKMLCFKGGETQRHFDRSLMLCLGSWPVLTAEKIYPVNRVRLKKLTPGE